MKIDELLEQHGIETIQKTTRITKENLKKIIAKDFENLNKTQVFGFLSILEREYGTIEDLRESAQEYFADIQESENLTLSTKPDTSLLLSMKPRKAFDSQLIIVISGLFIIIFVAFMAFDTNSKENLQIPKMMVDLNDTNATLDTNSSNVNSSDVNSTIKNEINATSSNVEQNMTVTAKKLYPNKTKKDYGAGKAHSADDNKSIAATKAKTDSNNHKNDYLKVEDGNKSQ